MKLSKETNSKDKKCFTLKLLSNQTNSNLQNMRKKDYKFN